MMLEFSPEEEKLWDMMDHEKDPKKWKELHEKYRKLRKEREDRELRLYFCSLRYRQPKGRWYFYTQF